MAVPTTDGYDITSANYSHRPLAGQPAFYSTGSPEIKATPAMWNAYPGALRIDQANGSDDTADIFDCEKGCYNATQVASRVTVAINTFKLATRPGQRWPAVYVSRNGPAGYNPTDVVNACNSAGLAKQSIGLVIADWDGSRAKAMTEVGNSVPGANNPYPVVGRQYLNAGIYDLDIFSVPWLDRVSVKGSPTVQVQKDWLWCYKCDGLFYGPRVSESVCPKGGHHDGSRSYKYELNFLP